MRHGKNLYLLFPSHIRYVRFLSAFRAKRAFLMCPGKKFSSERLSVSGIGYICISVSRLTYDMSDFCVRRCKNCCFLASAEKFFPQKKTGSSAHPRFQSILPSIYLNICWSSDVVCPTSPHTSFPRTCPFQVSNYNIDISEIFTNPPATSPVSASLSLFPVPPARSPSATLSSFSEPHTSPCPCSSPSPGTHPHPISIL